MILYYYKIDNDGMFNINLPSQHTGKPKESFLRKIVTTAHDNWCNDNSLFPTKKEERKKRKVISVYSVDTNDLKTRKELFKW